jgi:hypothetical protein
MKNYILYIFISLITLSLFSCKKKDDFHKVTYEVTFLDQPSKGHSDFLQLNCYPTYSGSKAPVLSQQLVPKVWKYDYYGLKVGDVVHIDLRAQLSYEYEMKIYIDDTEVSYLHVIVSDYNYFDDHVLERSGLNIYSIASTSPSGMVEDWGGIEFTYK